MGYERESVSVANSRSAASEIVLLGRPYTHCDYDQEIIEYLTLAAMTIDNMLWGCDLWG